MPRKLGIIAGGGTLPALAIAACQGTNRPFFVFALEGFADPSPLDDVPHAWVRLGAAGEALALARAHGVQDLLLVGPVKRPSLAALRPDLEMAKILAKAGISSLAMGDDSLLRTVIRLIEQNGFAVIGVEELLADLVADAGVYGTLQPDKKARVDIARGWQVAKAMGAVDVGQSVVVQEGIVLGVEAAEGTDRLIDRCRDLADPDGPGAVLVKTRKPHQERRVDLPTIGPDTVRRAAAAGFGGIAFEAGGTVVIDRPATVQAADAAGVFLVGVEEEED